MDVEERPVLSAALAGANAMLAMACSGGPSVGKPGLGVLLSCGCGSGPTARHTVWTHKALAPCSLQCTSGICMCVSWRVACVSPLLTAPL